MMRRPPKSTLFPYTTLSGLDVISLGQYRWDPVPLPSRSSSGAVAREEITPLTWLTGMRTMTTAGDVNTQVGMASHIYLVTASMVDDYFYSADSALLVVPQEGRLRFYTELGIIDLEPQEIAILPRGLLYRDLDAENMLGITAFRCPTCGLLRSYALDQN